MQSYTGMVMIQATAEMSNELAAMIAEGEISGLEGMIVLIFLAAFIEVIDEAIPDIAPPKFLEPYWEQLLDYKEDLKNILGRWFNEEINSSDVMEELEPLLEDINDTMTDMDRVLATEYGQDPAELTQIREEKLAELRSEFDELSP